MKSLVTLKSLTLVDVLVFMTYDVHTKNIQIILEIGIPMTIPYYTIVNHVQTFLYQPGSSILKVLLFLIVFNTFLNKYFSEYIEIISKHKNWTKKSLNNKNKQFLNLFFFLKSFWINLCIHRKIILFVQENKRKYENAF